MENNTCLRHDIGAAAGTFRISVGFKEVGWSSRRTYAEAHARWDGADRAEFSVVVPHSLASSTDGRRSGSNAGLPPDTVG